MLDQDACRNDRMAARERATDGSRTIAASAAPHSGPTSAGRLPTRCVIDRPSASGSRLSQCSGTAGAGA